MTCIWGKCLIFGKTLDKMLEIFSIYTKIDNLPRILSVSLPKTMTHVVNREIKFQPGSVSLATFAAHMPFIIRVWHAKDKHSQTLTDYWFERVSLHHQCWEFYSTKVFPFQLWKIFGAHIKKCVCWALLYIRISWKLSQRQHWAPILMATWNKAKSSGWLSQHWMWLLWLPISLRIVRRR